MGAETEQKRQQTPIKSLPKGVITTLIYMGKKRNALFINPSTFEQTKIKKSHDGNRDAPLSFPNAVQTLKIPKI